MRVVFKALVDGVDERVRVLRLGDFLGATLEGLLLALHVLEGPALGLQLLRRGGLARLALGVSLLWVQGSFHIID